MVTECADGQKMTFRIYLPHAHRVDLVGDFTGWEENAIAMARADSPDDGWWRAECAIPDGDHQFSYLVNGTYWLPDYAATGVRRNEYGRWTSNLSVKRLPATPSRPSAHAYPRAPETHGR